MDRLVSVDVPEVSLDFRPSRRCSSASFRVSNLMHAIPVAVHLTTTRPALFSVSPDVAVIPPLSSLSFSLILPAAAHPPITAPPDAVIVRSALLPTGRNPDLRRLFSRHSTRIFRDAHVPIRISSSPAHLHALLRKSSAAGDAALVAELLKSGADPSAGALPLAISSGGFSAVKALLDSGADAGVPDVIAAAVVAGGSDDIDILRLLAAVSARPSWADATGPDGRTATHAAAAAGGLDAVIFCVESGGGDPDRPDAQGWTSLHCAAAGGFRDVAEYLMGRSAYDACRAVTCAGKTPYDLAAEGAHAGMYGALCLDGELHAAARAGDAGGLRECLSRGAEVDARDQNGWTPLHRAAFKGRVEAVRVLIAHGATVDAVDDVGYTPLRCAVEAGRGEVVLWLVAYGAGMKGIKGAPELSSPLTSVPRELRNFEFDIS